MNMRWLLLALLLSLQAFAGIHKSVTIRSSFDAPGYVEIDAEGRKTGYEVELANAIFTSQGYKIDWQVVTWEDIVADLSVASNDKDFAYIASIEGTKQRRQNWLFGAAVEYDASHYFYTDASTSSLRTGKVVDSKTGKVIPHFILDIPQNRLDGKKLRVATWKGSALEHELRRVYQSPAHIEVVPLAGNPIEWIKSGAADVIYIYASGPKNSFGGAGLAQVSGPITNFDLDRFAGTSVVLPMNSLGQEMGRIWLDGFAKILRDDTFFKISYKWFGRVSWPAEFNGFLVNDQADFDRRLKAFEESQKVKLD